MKKAICAVIVSLLLASAAGAKIKLPDAREITLDNGLKVRVIERPSLPLVSVHMTFRAGSYTDPADAHGLANLCNEMLMRGTDSRTARQIAEEIAFGGGRLENFCTRDRAGFTGEFLSQYGEKGFEIIGDILLHSTFTDDELAKTRSRLAAELDSRFDDPRSIATEYIFSELTAGNAYAHIPKGDPESLAGLTRDDIVGFFENHYTPDNCLLVVCGDIDEATVKRWGNTHLGSWNRKAAFSPPQADFPAPSGTEILVLDKPDATQTQIRIGTAGLPSNHPDYVPFELARTIYGGSFTSRLVNEIRVNRGLTYGVRYESFNYLPGGLAYVSTFTRNDAVGEVLDIILAEASRMQTEAVPDSELVGAINYRCGLYPLRFETSDQIAQVYSDIWFYGLDKDYYENFQEKIRTVSDGDVIEVARRYFPINSYRVVLVGRADELTSQLDKYGPVTVRTLGE